MHILYEKTRFHWHGSDMQDGFLLEPNLQEASILNSQQNGYTFVLSCSKCMTVNCLVQFTPNKCIYKHMYLNQPPPTHQYNDQF